MEKSKKSEIKANLILPIFQSSKPSLSLTTSLQNLMEKIQCMKLYSKSLKCYWVIKVTVSSYTNSLYFFYTQNLTATYSPFASKQYSFDQLEKSDIRASKTHIDLKKRQPSITQHTWIYLLTRNILIFEHTNMTLFSICSEEYHMPAKSEYDTWQTERDSYYAQTPSISSIHKT